MHHWLVVSTPLKNMKVNWDDYSILFPIYGKIKNVPNHQPDHVGLVLIHLSPLGLADSMKQMRITSNTMRGPYVAMYLALYARVD